MEPDGLEMVLVMEAVGALLQQQEHLFHQDEEYPRLRLHPQPHRQALGLIAVHLLVRLLAPP